MACQITSESTHTRLLVMHHMITTVKLLCMRKSFEQASIFYLSLSLSLSLSLIYIYIYPVLQLVRTRPGSYPYSIVVLRWVVVWQKGIWLALYCYSVGQGHVGSLRQVQQLPRSHFCSSRDTQRTQHNRRKTRGKHTTYFEATRHCLHVNHSRRIDMAMGTGEQSNPGDKLAQEDGHLVGLCRKRQTNEKDRKNKTGVNGHKLLQHSLGCGLPY